MIARGHQPAKNKWAFNWFWKAYVASKFPKQLQTTSVGCYELVNNWIKTQAINVIMRHIAHCYILKFFLGLRNGNAFTVAETGEPSIFRQNALECTKLHIKFQLLPDPRPLGALPPDPREGREGNGGSHMAHRTALISVSVALIARHQITLRDHGYGDNALHGASAYSPAIKPVPNIQT